MEPGHLLGELGSLLSEARGGVFSGYGGRWRERAGSCPWPAQPCPSLSQVELATGQFPYKNCKTDFEVLTKVLQEEPPLLPGHMGFSGDFQSFVKDW